MFVLWRALIAFCELSDDQHAKGFGKLLSNKKNLLLLYLLADVLFHLKCIQKMLQADGMTIVEIAPEMQKFVCKSEKSGRNSLCLEGLCNKL